MEERKPAIGEATEEAVKEEVLKEEVMEDKNVLPEIPGAYTPDGALPNAVPAKRQERGFIKGHTFRKTRRGNQLALPKIPGACLMAKCLQKSLKLLKLQNSMPLHMKRQL